MAYEFDDDFQTKIAALALRDRDFNVQTEGLIDPAYLSNDAEAHIVSLVQKFWSRYQALPTRTTLNRMIETAVSKKIIRDDLEDEIEGKIEELQGVDISDRDFVVEEVSEFARHQAYLGAAEKMIDLLEKRDFPSIEIEMARAAQVGSHDSGEEMDFFSSSAERRARREDVASGKIKRDSIPTGYAELDDVLYHKGFGRKELFLLMGGAKKGKSIGLMNFGVNAAQAGYNVLHISLENSLEITADRMDSYISRVRMDDLMTNAAKVDAAVSDWAGKSGLYKLHEYPTRTLKPSGLRRLLEKYRARGINFDLLVLDYVDIMAPEHILRNGIEESANTIAAVRAIAQSYNLAAVSATQTNREGHKSHQADATHVAEDFNKVRIADAVVSINSTEEEREDNEARLYFAAGRNQRDGFSLTIKQRLDRMCFIERVIRSKVSF